MTAIGKCDRKGRPLAGHALDGDAAAEHLAEMLGYRETKPGAAISPAGRHVSLAEGLEQPSLLLFRHPDPSVADDEGDLPVTGLYIELDLPLMGKFAGVAQQI